MDKVKDYVRSGDVIQTVLSQRFVKYFKPAPIDLYRALRTVNPSPYMFLMEDPDLLLSEPHPKCMFASQVTKSKYAYRRYTASR